MDVCVCIQKVFMDGGGGDDDHDHDDAAAAAQHVIDKKRHWGLWWLVAVGSVRNGSSMAGHGCLTLAV